MGLIFAANIVIIDLAKKANIILIIPNMVSQTRVHSISTVRVVFHDEAGKVSELDNLTRFA